jgi:hypothetical protein
VGFEVFSTSGKREEDVIVGNGRCDWNIYCFGYKQAADALVSHLFKKHDYSAYGESQCYPIIFLYRHYLELRLKELLIAYGHLLLESTQVRGHRLAPLWQKVREMADKAQSESDPEIDADLAMLGEIIEEFDKVDTKSEVFRYPVCKDNETTTLPLFHTVDLHQLKQVMDWAAYTLDGWSTGVYEYIAERNSNANAEQISATND